MRPASTIRALIPALFAGLLATAGARAQFVADAYEEPPTPSPGEVLPARLLHSGQHHFDDAVEHDGRMLVFTIDSPFGRYRVKSMAMAALRVHEIDVLAQAIDHFNRGNRPLADSLRGRLEVGAESFVDILVSPLTTTTKIVGQFSRNVGRTFEELGKFPDPGASQPDSDPYSRLVPGDEVLAAHKRSVARQLGLDPYSSNPRVQDFLDTVAKARASGRSSAGMLSVAAAGGAPGVAGGTVDAAIDARVARYSLEELQGDNERRLAAMGLDPGLIQRFVHHRALSPRHETAIVAHLEFLAGVRGRGAVLEAALASRDESGALGAENSVRMLARYHDSFAPLREIIPGGEVLVGVSEEQRLIVVLPFDQIAWIRETDETLGGLADFAGEHGYLGRVLVSAGVVSARARRQLARLGFELHERFLLTP